MCAMSLRASGPLVDFLSAKATFLEFSVVYNSPSPDGAKSTLLLSSMVTSVDLVPLPVVTADDVLSSNACDVEGENVNELTDTSPQLSVSVSLESRSTSQSAVLSVSVDDEELVW